jgi:predicted membrane protein
MHTAIFGSLDEGGFPPGWTDERVLTLFGSAELDLRRRPPGENATLTATAIFGSIEITVPRGTGVRASGFSVLGSRKVGTSPGTEQVVGMKFNSVLGSVEIKEAEL